MRKCIIVSSRESVVMGYCSVSVAVVSVQPSVVSEGVAQLSEHIKTTGESIRGWSGGGKSNFSLKTLNYL